MVSILSQSSQENNPQSFWSSPAMRARLERGGPLAACAKNAPTEALKSEALYKESKINININTVKTINLEENLVKTINHARDYTGLRVKVNSDPVLVMLQDWGVGAPFIYASVRDFGEARVKEAAHRIAKLRDGYFRQGSPIPQQRGRIFNKEMQKLREVRA